jgi:hypothetical protein
MQIAAVFTGDLIGSTKAGPDATDRAIAAIEAASRGIGAWAPESTRFARFRGDGWQICLTRPALALRATLYLLARLKAEGGGLKTRLSLAIDTIDRLGATGLSEASGAAFVLSGRNLDRGFDRLPGFTFAAPGATELWKEAVFDLAVWQATRWTLTQAEAVALALELPRQSDEALAIGLGITRQAFQARLKGAGIAFTSAGLAAFEIEDTHG